MSDQDQVTFQRFERTVIFPSARILPVLLSVIAMLMLIGAGVGLLYSFIPPDEPRPEKKVDAVSVTPSDVDHLIKQGMPQKSSSKPEGEAPPNQPTGSAGGMELAAEIGKVRSQASALMLPWNDQEETRCKEKVYGYCIGQHKVVVSRGVIGYLAEAFMPYRSELDDYESVTVSGNTYKLKVSEEKPMLAIIKELEAVLSSATAANAGQKMQAWAALREERETKRADAIKSAEREREEEKQRYESALANRHMARNWSLSSAALALGALVLFGLTLAVLAVERHTRMLEQMMQGTPGSATHRTTAASRLAALAGTEAP